MSASGSRSSTYPWYTGPAALAVRFLEQALFASYRLVTTSAEDHLDKAAAHGRPCLFVFWHNRSHYLGYFLRRRWIGRGKQLGILTSRSRDGEIAARIARAVGFRVARGSVSGGGLAGLKQMHRMLRRENTSVLSVADGSRGPIYVAQTGMVVLAQTAGVPLVPLSYAPSRCWRLGSWDRMIVPKPFARVAVAVGEPTRYAERLDDAELEAAREHLENRLEALGRTAETLLDA